MTRSPTFSFNGSLSEEHSTFFKERGYLHFKKVISSELLELCKSEIVMIMEGLLKEKPQKINGVPVKYGYDEHDQLIVQRLPFASKYGSNLKALIKSDFISMLKNLLHPYKSRISENEKDGLVVNHYLRSNKSKFSKMGWHTDCMRDIFFGQRMMPMINVGIHLLDCPPDNGGLRVLPGTHKQSLFQLLFRKRYFTDNSPDADEVVFDIEAGDVTVHDGRIWHRVEQSQHTGEKSRRMVMYIPIITGNYKPKLQSARTPFYYHFANKVFK